MDMNKTYFVIFAIAGITFGFRYLPFALNQYIRTNKSLQFIQAFLPASIMLLLSLFTLKDTPMHTPPYGLIELISVVLVIAIHAKWRHPLLSIAIGTGFYIACKNIFLLN